MENTQTNNKRQWLWEYALGMPKGSVRALVFLIVVGALIYLAVEMVGGVQEEKTRIAIISAIIGALISIATSATEKYFGKDKT